MKAHLRKETIECTVRSDESLSMGPKKTLQWREASAMVMSRQIRALKRKKISARMKRNVFGDRKPATPDSPHLAVFLLRLLEPYERLDPLPGPSHLLLLLSPRTAAATGGGGPVFFSQRGRWCWWATDTRTRSGAAPHHTHCSTAFGKTKSAARQMGGVRVRVRVLWLCSGGDGEEALCVWGGGI